MFGGDGTDVETLIGCGGGAGAFSGGSALGAAVETLTSCGTAACATPQGTVIAARGAGRLLLSREI